MFWDWIKGLLSPKKLVAQAIDALDLLTPALAYEIDNVKTKFIAMNSTEKALWIIDQVQAFLRKRFGIDA